MAGAAGSATGGLVQGVGNAAYFNDSYSVKDWAVGVAVGGILGGVGGGVAARIKGGANTNLIWGSKIGSGRNAWSWNNSPIGKNASGAGGNLTLSVDQPMVDGWDLNLTNKSKFLPVTGLDDEISGSSFNAVGAFKDAISAYKGGDLTNAGRAVTKHPEYFGFDSDKALRQVYRSSKELNDLGASSVKNILREGVRTTGAGGRYPNGWVTYTAPNGNAASWELSGKFIGFRGVRK